MTIERVIKTEQIFSVELSGLYADVDEDGYLTVNGEVIGVGPGPKYDFNVVLTAFDSSGRILYTSENYIEMAGFVGFETFSFFSQTGPVARIRVHVKPE